MSDPLEIVVECDSPEDVFNALGRITTRLPMAVKRPFSDLLVSVFLDYPQEQLFHMVRGLTVGEILRRFETVPRRKPIASGVMDGKKWALYAPPDPKPADPTD
jgi:hypothetical protein